jgi:predicted HAD superfamily hydrolase/glycosyltransferase involved in cell wall biosynthesis
MLEHSQSSFSQRPSALKKANSLFHQKDYVGALEHYLEAAHSCPELSGYLRFNIMLCSKSLGRSSDYSEGASGCQIQPDAPDEKSQSQQISHKHEAELRLIRDSAFFDSKYYLAENHDVRVNGINPSLHYLLFGFKEGRDPSPNFNTRFYLDNNPDVQAAQINPLIHWLRYGKNEGRSIQKKIVKSNTISPSSPSLLFVSHEASQTGAPSVLLSLIRWFKTKTSINFAILVGRRGEWDHKFEELGPTFFFEEEHFDLEHELMRFCGSNVKCVFLNTVASADYGRSLAFLGAEYVAYIHEMRGVLQQFSNQAKVMTSLCRKYIACSPSVMNDAKLFFTNPEASFSLVSPCINNTGFPQSQIPLSAIPGTIQIYSCGTVTKRKGFDLFCKVALLLKKRYPNAPVVMNWIGKEVGEIDALALIGENSVGDIVKFLGPKDSPKVYFANGDIFLLLSREDPYPLVCLEAADCKLPIICFDHQAGGMHSFVGQDECGIVVEYMNLEKVVESIMNLVNNQALRREKGIKAKAKVASNHYVDAVAPLIKELLPESVERESINRLAMYTDRIDGYPAISFDIFDTLIVRKFSDPSCIFSIAQGNLSRNACVPVDFENLRMNTAGRALAKHNGKLDDISIDEIYSEIPLYPIAELEKSLEVEACIAHPIGKKIYEYAVMSGKKVIIASDMYLDVDTIKNILEANGYSRWDKLLLSSDIGKKKSTGKLFDTLADEIMNQWNLSPEQVLHIGDSWLGDVDMPKSYNFGALRFTPFQESSTKLFRVEEARLSKNGKLWSSISEQANNLWISNKPDLLNEIGIRLGFEVSGPLSAAMAMHSYHSAKHYDANKIAFLARDGRIIYEAFMSIYPKAATDSNISSCYVHLSRSTVIPATLQHPLSDNDIYFLTEGIFLGEKDVAYFIAKAGLDVHDKEVCAIVLKYFSATSTLLNGDDIAQASKMFKELSELIYAANKLSREALLEYIKTFFFPGDRVILVDVGWLLNIHSRLQRFCEENSLDISFFGAYVGSSSRSDRLIKHSNLLFKYDEPKDIADVINSNITLFEFFFSSPEAPAVALKCGAGGNDGMVVHKPGFLLKKECIAAKSLHYGARQYFNYIAGIIHSFPGALEPSIDYALGLFREVCQTRNDQIVAYLQSIDVALGGHHELSGSQKLLNGDWHVEYEIEVSIDYFRPMFFGGENSSTSLVVIISSAGLANGSTRYRAIHLAKCLANKGVSSVVLHSHTPISQYMVLLSKSHAVVFQRCFAEQGNVGEFLRLCRESGTLCVSDIDDLVFPDHVSTIGSVKGGEWSHCEAIRVSSGYERLMQAVDVAMASTPLIANYLGAKYGLKTLVFRNKIDLDCRGERESDLLEFRNKFRILYPSGTMSHGQDFRGVQDVIYQFIAGNPMAELTLLGATQVDERLVSLPNVSSYPVVPYEDMMRVYAHHDLVIVPLEDDAFNNGKSAVKYLEASLNSTPILASPVSEFDRYIIHMSNGMLAADSSDWHNLLCWSQSNSQPLKRMGEAANYSLRDFDTTTFLEQDVLEVLRPRS